MASRIRPPSFTEEEVRAFRAFHDVLAPAKDRIDREVREAALRVPVFAALARDIAPDPAQQERSRRLEREALVDQKWDAYLEDLAGQGAFYAQLGVEFAEWYPLLTPYRGIIHEHSLSPSVADPRAVIAGMNRFLDVAMATLASAYLETKEALVRDAEAQRNLYADMFRNASLGMLVYEWSEPPDLGSFRLVAANPAAAQIGASRIHDQVGRTIREVTPALLDTDVPAHYAAAVDQREARSWTIEYIVGGAAQIYDVRCFPLERRCVGVIFENATTRVRMAVELERHVRDLERSNRDLDDFAYIASHDLKAPLRNIDNLATWIVEDAGSVLPEPSRRHLAVLQDRARRLERLLEDLLQYSRAGRASAPSEEFDLGAVVAEVTQLMGPRPGFTIEVRGDRPTVRAPRVPFAVVMTNLVTNAVKHHHRSEGRVVVDVADGPERVTIAVTDDGPGIPEEFHERVFRMFQTLRPRDQVEGSGIGLTIVKKLVELNGGNVRIESRAGEGTTVRFDWPKAWPPASGAAR